MERAEAIKKNVYESSKRQMASRVEELLGETGAYYELFECCGEYRFTGLYQTDSDRIVDFLKKERKVRYYTCGDDESGDYDHDWKNGYAVVIH